jgi:hypothetical protein|tara:strand:+ start:47 stop:226 length:180 start_codon:yes stop_codon:yes gene_type:complete
MKQTGFEQLSKEMAVFAQNNYKSYDTLRKFFLYELELRCLNKRELRETMIKLTEEVDEK